MTGSLAESEWLTLWEAAGVVEVAALAFAALAMLDDELRAAV